MSQEIARVAPELDEFARLGKWLAASEVENPTEDQKGATAALRLYFARDLGLSVLAASELSVIRGRLVVGAKLLRARAAVYGYRVERVKGDETSCTARLVKRDSGEVLGESSFTIEDARRAGLIREKGNWKTYPARMLWARASKFVLDDFAPEVSLGLVLEDEAAEIIGEVTGEEWDGSPETRPAQEGGLLGEPVEDHVEDQEWVDQSDFVAPEPREK